MGKSILYFVSSCPLLCSNMVEESIPPSDGLIPGGQYFTIYYNLGVSTHALENSVTPPLLSLSLVVVLDSRN